MLDVLRQALRSAILSSAKEKYVAMKLASGGTDHHRGSFMNIVSLCRQAVQAKSIRKTGGKMKSPPDSNYFRLHPEDLGVH